MSRLEQLHKILEKRPTDPFALYGLALEYRNSGHQEKAIECFERLLEADPDYVPAYYQFGTLLLEVENQSLAREILSRGLDAAARGGDEKAKAELSAVLQDLES